MNKEIINLLKKNIIYVALVFVAIIGAVYFLFLTENAPVISTARSIKLNHSLSKEIKSLNAELQSVLEDNKRKNESAKETQTKEFYKTDAVGDIVSNFSPLFDNVITMIKQNGLRMKSINYTPSPADDAILTKGAGIYNGCKIDFELVGYYSQFAVFLNDLQSYPYFININKFEISPYQYDKKILVANVSLTFYSKK